VTAKGDGSRCAFAALALCSDKISGKGLEVTHWLFENQEQFYPITDGKTLLPKIKEKFGIEEKALGDCADSAETYALLNKSAQEGEHAGVEGTPTIYVNGKKLPWGHVPAVLSQVIQ
jgi:protein-disulfide isomerase